MSKKQNRILKYLQDFGSITSIEAISELGDTRLAATIFCLRKKGYHIISIPQTNINRYGEKVRYAKYELIENVS